MMKHSRRRWAQGRSTPTKNLGTHPRRTGHLVLIRTLDGLDVAFAGLLGANGSRTSEGHTRPYRPTGLELKTKRMRTDLLTQ